MLVRFINKTVESPKFHMQRQWGLEGGMAGTFKEMK